MSWQQLSIAAVIVTVLIAGWYRFSVSRGVLAKALELCLWLAPILTLGALRGAYTALGIVSFWIIALIQLAFIGWAVRRAHPSAQGRLGGERLAGLLLANGAICVWLGAVTFPGGGLEAIAANRSGYLSTVAGFTIGTLLSIAGFAELRSVLRGRSEERFSTLGFIALGIGTVCWLLHLAFRATVTASVATHFAVPPDWYEPLRQWAGGMYAIYMVLGYLSAAFFGAALHRAGLCSKGWGRAFVAFGVVAAAGFPTGAFAPPLMVQFPPYAMGMILLRRSARNSR